MNEGPNRDKLPPSGSPAGNSDSTANGGSVAHRLLPGALLISSKPRPSTRPGPAQGSENPEAIPMQELKHRRRYRRNPRCSRSRNGEPMELLSQPDIDKAETANYECGVILYFSTRQAYQTVGRTSNDCNLLPQYSETCASGAP